MSDWLVYFGASLTIGAILVILHLVDMHETRVWEEFKLAHSCKIVGKVDSQVVNTIDFNRGSGIGTSFIAGKTGWACDNGVTYWK